MLGQELVFRKAWVGFQYFYRKAEQAVFGPQGHFVPVLDLEKLLRERFQLIDADLVQFFR